MVPLGDAINTLNVVVHGWLGLAGPGARAGPYKALKPTGRRTKPTERARSPGRPRAVGPRWPAAVTVMVTDRDYTIT